MLAVLSCLDLLYWRESKVERIGVSWISGLDPKAFLRGFVVTTVFLVVAALCLLIDIGRPERFYFVFLHPTSSVLTFGAISLSISAALAFLMAAVCLLGPNRLPLWAISAMEIAGVVFGIATATYTGVFLYQMDFIPYWHNPILPVLFLSSSISVGLASVSGCFLSFGRNAYEGVCAACERAEVTAILVEMLVVALFLAALGVLYGELVLSSFVFGDNAVWFIGCFVGLALFAPLVLAAIRTRVDSSGLAMASVVCSLIGGFFLRYCVVNAPFPLFV